ncbi:MAG: ABC transporter permease [Planctomycetota bacterium]|nr:ABC transporter permease [Planctomycetota bacterium]
MLVLIRSLRKNRRLLQDMVRRDLRARYVGSSMGFFWSVIFPLLNLVIYMFVFTFVMKSRWDEGQSNQEVALLMLAGILVWQAFAETVSRSTNTLVENQNLIQKVVFPSEVLPVYLGVSALVNMLIGVAIALIGVAFYAWISPIVPEAGAPAPQRALGFSYTLVALPLLFAIQLVFTIGLGFFFSALNLFLRDVYHVMGVALMVGMFMTPIFYPAYLVQKAGLGWVLKINPMYWLIDSYRRVLIYGLWPQPPVVAAFAGVAIVVFALGAVFFLRQKPRFPDLL